MRKPTPPPTADPGMANPRKPRGSRARPRTQLRLPGRHIPAGKFKAVCLQLMDRVRDTGEEIIITKRNTPVAKLVPVTSGEIRPFVGRSRGVISATRDDLLAPVDGDWEPGADL